MFRSARLPVLLCLCLTLAAAPAEAATPASAGRNVSGNAALDAHAEPPSLIVLRGLAPVSLASTGLLDYLAPWLTQETGLIVVWKTAGDTQTLARARACGGDILLTVTSDPEAPAVTSLLQEGHVLTRQEVMKDSYVLVGPTRDPAGIMGMDVPDALRALADGRAPFVSRGDASGTHRRELFLWKEAGRTVQDGKNGYQETGQGMIATLDAAAAAQAYTLTDRASFLTWSATRNNRLVVLAEDDPRLVRNWSMVSLNPALCPPADRDVPLVAELPEDNGTAPGDESSRRQVAVQRLMEWWIGPSAQKRIAEFAREGQTLFSPALPVEADAGSPEKRR